LQDVKRQVSIKILQNRTQIGRVRIANNSYSPKSELEPPA